MSGRGHGPSIADFLGDASHADRGKVMSGTLLRSFYNDSGRFYPFAKRMLVRTFSQKGAPATGSCDQVARSEGIGGVNCEHGTPWQPCSARSDHGHSDHGHRRLRPISAVLCLGIGLLIFGCDSTPESPPTVEIVPQDEPADAKTLLMAAIKAGDWATAEQHANQALIASPDDPALVTEVAKVNAMRGRKRDAAKMLIEAAKLANFQPSGRVGFAVEALMEVGEVYLAIELLEQSLNENPEDDKQRRMLVGFLGEVQRTEKMGPHLMKLIQRRAFDMNLLIATSDTATRRFSEKTASRLLERNPDDHRVRLAEAFLHMYRHNAKDATDVLQDILQRHPRFAPAHAMYGQALTLAQRWDDLPRWFSSAPAESRRYANYWLTLGDAADENGDDAMAVRAYWEATQRDSNSNVAWDRLRVSMQKLRASDSEYRDAVSDEQLEIVNKHANGLLEFHERFNDFAGGGKVSQTDAMRVANKLYELGRLWEAEAWSALATTLTDDLSPQMGQDRKRILASLRKDTAWIASDLPARQLRFDQMPEPKIGSAFASTQRDAVIPDMTTHDHLRLTEQSERWGLKGVGDGNNSEDARLGALIRSTGVGGGAIDFDLDGLTDVLIMNAGGTMQKVDSQPNQLMRNVGDVFVDASVSAGVDDRGYGQGVAVGDFNEDGLPDLFFANLGENRLLQNNGDGTFRDCTESLDDAGRAHWTTSGSFVDINEDGISDLIITNYCKTVEKLDKPCTKEKELGPCHPLTFPAEFDQVFMGTGTGRFVERTSQWIKNPAPGRGLGVVSGKLDGQTLGIFVANDMTRNSFYAPDSDSEFHLGESAAARGVAVDGLTRAQASMGIASSDFDLDGDLDFYVTGFAREYNVMYTQTSPGMWVDETGKLGLIEPTLFMIGFGTEAIDLDNDGIDEIVVTNGHIGEFKEPGAPPYELPLQVFRRGERGRFDLIEDDPWGDYFRKPHVGRTLWTTDVNRDGREDFFVTHTDEQVRLMVNETDTKGHDRIAFVLNAVKNSRDGVGAIIRFKSNGQPRTLWRLSGDGYFCSNEKTLIAGLSEASEITDLTVTWQDGSIDEIGTLPTNRIYHITQGHAEAFELYRYPEQ